MTFSVAQDRTLINRSGGSNRYLLARVEAPLAEAAAKRQPVNIALVIDRSGSMAGEKLQYAIDAACYAVGLLHPADRFAVIAYDDTVDVVVPSTPATAEARRDATARIRRVDTRGCTNLFDGWMRGCQQIAEYLHEEAIGRCLLLTDGLANRGVVNADEIVNHAANLRRRQVSTSTFGIGAGFDENLLDRMARGGGGNFYFISSGADIPGFLDQEIGEALEVVARDAVINVDAAPGCEIQSLNEFPVERGPGGVRISLGNLVSGQEIEPLLRVRFPGGEVGASQRLTLSLSSRDERVQGGPEALVFTYASGAENDAQARNGRVDRQVAKIYAARARQQAALLNRARNFKGAMRAVEACAERIADYAGTDPELHELLNALRADREMFAEEMDNMKRKRVYSSSSSEMLERSSLGFSKRRSSGETMVIIPASKGLARIARSALAATDHGFRRHLPAVELLEGFPRANPGLDFELTGERPLPPIEELQLAEQGSRFARRYGACLFLIERPFENNWFSHWHARQYTAIATLAGLGDPRKLLPVAYVAQEILLHVLHLVSATYDLDYLAHEETRGCLFDLCGDKRDMEIKLQTMDVCGDCRSGLRRMQITPERVMQACSTVRDLAVGGGRTPDIGMRPVGDSWQHP